VDVRGHQAGEEITRLTARVEGPLRGLQTHSKRDAGRRLGSGPPRTERSARRQACHPQQFSLL